MPVRKPVMGEIDTTSPFGVRMDPFLRVPAMHTGLDFRGNTGDPVRATAAGTVTIAGWSGGYGKMVEVDHGNGFATRYGHLSEIDVKVGQSASRSARPSAASAPPAARPARTCITRRASTARRSTRRNSCAPASGWAGFGRL